MGCQEMSRNVKKIVVLATLIHFGLGPIGRFGREADKSSIKSVKRSGPNVKMGGISAIAPESILAPDSLRMTNFHTYPVNASNPAQRPKQIPGNNSFLVLGQILPIHLDRVGY